MKKFITSNTFLTTIGITLIFVIWFIVSLSQSGTFIFPNPIDTFVEFGKIITLKDTWTALGWSLLKTLMGFGLAFASALLLGFLVSFIPRLQVVLKPIVTAMKSAPTAAFVFLFVALITNQWAPIGIVYLLSFPILYEGVVGGLNAIPKQIMDLTRLEGHSKLTIWWKVKLPLSLPSIFVGVASSFGLAFKSEIMSEIIVGLAKDGLGALIVSYRNISSVDLTPIFAITLLAIIVVLITDLLMYFLKRYFTNLY